jgi:hypothetical protein
VTLAIDSGVSLLAWYKSLCSTDVEAEAVARLCPVTCARLRDPQHYAAIPFEVDVRQAQRIDVASISLNWLDEEPGNALIRAIGFEDLGVSAMPYCENRATFLRETTESYVELYSAELKFVEQFLHSIVWLKADRPEASFGSGSFYRVPHVTFISDASLFFVPPNHQLPRQHGGLGFLENLFHEALHHQIHAHCAFTRTTYCVSGVDAFHELVPFGLRKDRTFTYFQAINALHVYREISLIRRRLMASANPLDREFEWLRQGVQSAQLMWGGFCDALLKVESNLVQPWPALIRRWKEEHESLV